MDYHLQKQNHYLYEDIMIIYFNIIGENNTKVNYF